MEKKQGEDYGSWWPTQQRHHRDDDEARGFSSGIDRLHETTHTEQLTELPAQVK